MKKRKTMISLYDLTPYDFLLLCMHVISAMLYTALGIKIIQSKKYLKWNGHIYPRMMIASFGIALVFLSEIVARQNYNVFFHLFMWLHAANQFAEIFRLSEKFNKIEELEKKLNMKQIITITILAFLLVGCGSRKVELEQLKKTSTEKTAEYERKISELTGKISEKEKIESESKTTISQNKTEIENLKKERSVLQEKLKEEKKDDFIVKNANGIVKMTDFNGNTIEIPSGLGTEISKTSISSLTKEKTELQEKYNNEQYSNRILLKEVTARDLLLKEKNVEISALQDSVSAKDSNIKTLETEKKKNSEREAYPVWLWIGLGIVITIGVQLLWKVYKPKFIKS